MEMRPFGSTGETVSALGFGAAPLGGAYGEMTDARASGAVQRALELGVTVFDTSPYYGRTVSETRLGAALDGHRDGVFLITKCGRYGEAEFDFSEDRIARSVDESLARLRTDRVDLLLAHDIEFEEPGRILGEAVPALVRARDEGKARFIGVSGYPLAALEEIAAAAPLDAVLSYCNGNLLSRGLFRTLLPDCAARDQAVINASTLHMGVLTDAGPPDWHPAPQAVRDAGRAIARLCAARGTTVTEFALRYALAQPGIPCTLVGARSAEEIEHDVRALDGALDRELLAEIERVAAPVIEVTWPSGRWS